MLKRKFTEKPTLVHANPDLPFIVETDASNFAIGAVLSQRNEKNELHPICYFSRSLNKSERNYSIYDKELLAVISACKEWRHYLEGAKHQFTVLTDHKNLTFPRKPEMLSQRQIRWNLFLTRFDFEIKYRPGKEGGKPDTLSRRADYEKEENQLEDEEEITICLTIQEIERNLSALSIQGKLKEDFIECSKNDEEVQEINQMIQGKKEVTKKYKKLIQYFKMDEENPDILLYKDLIYVPKEMRRTIIEMYHDNPLSGHFSIIKTKELITRNFVWINMTEDISKYINSCVTCQKSKADRHKPYGLLMPLPTPKKPWSSLSLDFITDLPVSKNKFVIMVVVDRFTKMAHFVPFRMLPNAQIASDVFFREIFRLHGLPEEIISDRGTQFTAEFWQRLCLLLDIDHKLSSAHHPQTDGQTERVNGILEQYLRCYTNKRQDNWTDLLPYAEFAYNNAVQQSTKQTPFFSNYGLHPRSSPLVAAINSDEDGNKVRDIQRNFIFLSEQLRIAKERYKRYADIHRQEGPKIQVNDLVLLKRPDLIPNGNLKFSKKKI